jgi:hypothetical protein
MRRSQLITAIIVCCCATPTWASDAKPPQIEPAGKHQQVICKREKVLGSYIRRRVCRTRAQINQDREYARRRMQEGDRFIQATRTIMAPRG